MGRLRSHVDGSLSARSERVWVGPQVPGFVPLTHGTAELFVLDPIPDGTFLALYRDPYGASSCTLTERLNCDYSVALFGHCGEELWRVSLGEHLSRVDHLEVQDVRWDHGVLFFNEACQSYSKDAGGRCSSLVAVDPVADTRLWATKPLVSNNRFLVLEDYIVAGYGFSGERDRVSLIRRSDGKVVHRQPVSKAPENITLVEPGVVEVTVYPGDKTVHFRVLSGDGKAKLQRLAD